MAYLADHTKSMILEFCLSRSYSIEGLNPLLLSLRYYDWLAFYFQWRFVIKNANTPLKQVEQSQITVVSWAKLTWQGSTQEDLLRHNTLPFLALPWLAYGENSINSIMLIVKATVYCCCCYCYFYCFLQQILSTIMVTIEVVIFIYQEDHSQLLLDTPLSLSSLSFRSPRESLPSLQMTPLYSWNHSRYSLIACFILPFDFQKNYRKSMLELCYVAHLDQVLLHHASQGISLGIASVTAAYVQLVDFWALPSSSQD